MSKRIPKCDKCGNSEYVEQYDRYACLNCNEWLEAPCGCDENDCEFLPCPDKPNDVREQINYE